MLIGNNLALLNHQDAIGSFEQGAAMGDYDHRFIRSHMDKIIRNMTFRGLDPLRSSVYPKAKLKGRARMRGPG